MTMNTTWIVLDEKQVCSFSDLMTMSGLSRQELTELIDIGVIVALEKAEAADSLYSQRYVGTAKTARSLRDDFELDHHGMALAMTLLMRIEILQQQLAMVRAGIPVNY